MSHQEVVWAVTFSPDGKTVLTGSGDRTARLWSATDGSPVGAPIVHPANVNAVAFSPDGKRILTGSNDSTVRMWRASDGAPIGEVVQVNVFGRIRFDLVSQGRLVGAIQAENWRAWDFAIVDAAGTEVARIVKKWEGLARTLFTTADRYVVLVRYRLPEPLASMVLASALTVDTALKQDVRGFN